MSMKIKGYDIEPLCGWEWYDKHQNDHTHAEIESLTMVVSAPGSKLTIPNTKASKDIIKNMVKGDR